MSIVVLVVVNVTVIEIVLLCKELLFWCDCNLVIEEAVKVVELVVDVVELVFMVEEVVSKVLEQFPI